MFVLTTKILHNLHRSKGLNKAMDIFCRIKLSDFANRRLVESRRPIGEKPDQPVHTVLVRLAATSSRMQTQEHMAL